MSSVIHLIGNTISSLFRFFGIDFYKYYTQWYRKWKYQSTKSSATQNTGITIAVDLPSAFSLPQVGRDFIDRLSQTDIPFSLVDTRPPLLNLPSIPRDDFAHYAAFCNNRIAYPLAIQFSARDPIISRRRPVVFTPFWEFQSGLFEDNPHFFDGTRGAIVFSKFCYDYFRANAPTNYPIWQLPYPLNLNPEIIGRDETRQQFHIPSDCFAIFFNFDIYSGYDRKNPEGAIEAFALAFPCEPSVRFVLKVSSINADAAKMDALREKAIHLGIANRLILLTDNLARREMLSLIASCDVYLSLHRGEGLGLGMLEAMSVGVPVIATAYGGNTDFCTEETAFLVPFRLVKPQTDFSPFKYVKEWAEPDVDTAARHLKAVFADRVRREAKIQAAARLVAERYGRDEFRAQLGRIINATHC